jgi:hypothetical protein
MTCFQISKQQPKIDNNNMTNKSIPFLLIDSLTPAFLFIEHMVSFKCVNETCISTSKVVKNKLNIHIYIFIR